MTNQRNISEFILLGLSSDQKIFCFILFIFCYVAILVGNLLILVSIRCSILFHQPMYYFLSHLSYMDICYTSCMTPKLIGDLLLERKTICYGNCMLLVFSLHFLGMIEIFILTIMAIDCCVAICKPLHYMIVMKYRQDAILWSWLPGLGGGCPFLFSVLYDHQFALLWPP